MLSDFLGRGSVLREIVRSPRVVHRQLLERTAAEQIDAAVADRSDRQLRAVHQHADERRSHAGVVVARFRGAEHAPIRQQMAVRKRLPSNESVGSDTVEPR
jgi:hypothetical protein